MGGGGDGAPGSGAGPVADRAGRAADAAAQAVLETALIQEMTEYLGHEKHELYISVRAVASHLDRIRDKTGCRRRADLTRLALSAGLV